MEKIFENTKINKDKLLKYGFKYSNKVYTYQTEIMNSEFLLNITICDNVIKTILTDKNSGDEYTLHLSNAEGNFVGQIRNEYNKILSEIKNECFETCVFKSDYAHKIINYIKKKYDNDMEYLWKKFPNNAIARRLDNSKWYLAILTVKKDRLGFKSEDEVEVVNLRANTNELEEQINKKRIFRGYHMNKKNWITIVLDGSISIEEIYNRIDESYNLTAQRRKL